MISRISAAIRRLFLRGFVALISFPPPHSAGRWGRRLGRWGWTFLSPDRLRAISQLSRLDPSLSKATRTSLALQNFLHLGEVLVTGCSLATRSSGSPILNDSQRGIEIENLPEFMKHVRELCGQGGVIGVSGHLGAWELAGAATGAEGYPILAKRYPDPVEQEVVEGIRTRLGIRLIYQDQSLMRVIRLLRDGQMVSMLVDLDIRAMDGVHVPLLGEDAHTTAAPARLALKTGSVLFPYFLVKGAGSTYRFEWEEPIQIGVAESDLPEEEQILTLTRRMNESIERAIRRHPEQWVWMHRRWRSTPEVIMERKAREQSAGSVNS